MLILSPARPVVALILRRAAQGLRLAAETARGLADGLDPPFAAAARRPA